MEMLMMNPVSKTIGLVALHLAVWPVTTWAEDQPTVAFEKRPNDLLITIGGKAFATYVFDDGSTTRPFFKHLHAPDGTRVTRNHPPDPRKDPVDHPTFHPGLWMAFGDVSGADFWRNKDRIRHLGFVEAPSGGPGRGSFAVKNQYESGGRIVGTEVAHITISVRPAGYLMLWDSEFTPTDGDLIFGDQEEMGLGVRMATQLAVVKGGRIINSDGLADEAQAWGKQADWCAYAGTVDGHRSGVVLMPHPENFRRSWFHARNYGLLVANPFGRNAFTKEEKSKVVVKKGQSLRLRFGLLVFSGEPAPGAAYRDYLQTGTHGKDLRVRRSGTTLSPSCSRCLPFPSPETRLRLRDHTKDGCSYPPRATERAQSISPSTRPQRARRSSSMALTAANRLNSCVRAEGRAPAPGRMQRRGRR